MTPSSTTPSAEPVARATEPFNYQIGADLYFARALRSPRRAPTYRRFPDAAQAIRFAVEELSPEGLRGAFMEVDDERYGGAAIRSLYDDPSYPLSREERS